MLPIIFERRIRGANGRNWPGVVVMHPDAPLPAAVLAQEWWEAMHKLNPLNALRVAFSSHARRRMELTSHEVEVQAAAIIYGKDRHDYRVAEVDRMKRGYDGLFDAVTRAQMRAAMEAMSDEARRWVRQKVDKLERWK